MAAGTETGRTLSDRPANIQQNEFGNLIIDLHFVGVPNSILPFKTHFSYITGTSDVYPNTFLGLWTQYLHNVSE